MTQCDMTLPKRMTADQAPEASPLLTWLQAFNWVNYLGLAMFLAPILFGYGAVHYWLLLHETGLYYVSLYAQLGLLLMTWRQW